MLPGKTVTHNDKSDCTLASLRVQELPYSRQLEFNDATMRGVNDMNNGANVAQ